MLPCSIQLEFSGPRRYHSLPAPLLLSCDNSATCHRLKVQDHPGKFPTYVGAATIGRRALHLIQDTFCPRYISTMAKAKGRAKQFEDLDEHIAKGT
jgi:hypothetical protein